MTSRSGIITLLTDFGYEDEYVGVMKGVILCRYASARIVDISHGIAPQHIEQAAAILESSYLYFPRNSVHLIVVDPGVGTDRNILLLEAADHFFIAPDNGILSPLLHCPEKVRALYRLNSPSVAGSSTTFHGRDIMAPAAAELAAGGAPADMGQPVALSGCVIFALPGPLLEKDLVRGEVTGVDHFGNIITSIKVSDLGRLQHPLRVEIGGLYVEKIHTCYGDVAPLTLVALINSRGKLEIARNKGNAADFVACRMGDPVVVRQLS
jgi:S-adenosyl-L-methionine hydrolase (adenosine-forming)